MKKPLNNTADKTQNFILNMLKSENDFKNFV